MIVRDLIKKLEEYPQEWVVKMDTPYDDDVNQIEVDNENTIIYLCA